MKHAQSPLQYLHDRSILNEGTGCIEWTICTDRHGYGSVYRGKHNMGERVAHRLAYRVHHGDIPDGMMVCHTCDNRRCVNPDHLFLGTHRDNMDDMVEKGRARAGTYLAKAVLDQIKAAKGTMTQKEACARFGVGKGTVWRCWR